MKKFKNNKQAADTWVGQLIDPGEYHEIEAFELFRWQNDSKVLTDIASGDGLMNNGDADITDVADAINFLKDEDPSPRDSDGSPIQRAKVTNTGWGYQLHGLEFTTADRDSIYAKDADGNDVGFATIKLYDSNNAEITTELGEANCVKTVIDWEPTYDYEIIGGMFKIKSALNSDVRLWVTAIPDIPAIYGGSKVFATNVNLRYVGLEEGIRVDGRASKLLSYSATYHTNKIRCILKHSAGVKVDMHLIFEIFKP